MRDQQVQNAEGGQLNEMSEGDEGGQKVVGSQEMGQKGEGGGGQMSGQNSVI